MHACTIQHATQSSCRWNAPFRDRLASLFRIEICTRTNITEIALITKMQWKTFVAHQISHSVDARCVLSMPAGQSRIADCDVRLIMAATLRVNTYVNLQALSPLQHAVRFCRRQRTGDCLFFSNALLHSCTMTKDAVYQIWIDDGRCSQQRLCLFFMHDGQRVAHLMMNG